MLVVRHSLAHVCDRAVCRCYEQLVRLKEKYPERVVLLVGNRDVNKMRFTSELHDSELDFKTMAKGALIHLSVRLPSQPPDPSSSPTKNILF